MINSQNVFPELVLGLASLAEEPDRWAKAYPPGLRYAMNAISLEMKSAFPKTFSAFIALCHTPINTWFPYSSDSFNRDYALLVKAQLTEQASDYLYELPDDIFQIHRKNGFIPESVLDNWRMLEFLQQARGMEDAIEAQKLYATIRSFLIEHSWITRKDLIDLKRNNISEDTANWLKTTFYYQDDAEDKVYYCDYCGILRLVNKQLVGIKPSYCDDHQPGVPHIHSISVPSYLRMKKGIHLRTFLPGQAERILFEEAETLQDQYPDHLVKVVRYPGLDAYDMQVVFRDETWAIDVKDLADPQDLSRKIHPIQTGGDLDHAKAFYVVPDRRLQFISDYMDQVRRSTTLIKPPLYLVSQKEFCERLRTKCAELVKSSQ